MYAPQTPFLVLWKPCMEEEGIEGYLSENLPESRDNLLLQDGAVEVPAGKLEDVPSGRFPFSLSVYSAHVDNG